MDDNYHLIYQKIARSHNCANAESKPYRFAWTLMGHHVDAVVTNRDQIISDMNPPPIHMAGSVYANRVTHGPIELGLDVFEDADHRVRVPTGILYRALIQQINAYCDGVASSRGAPKHSELAKGLMVNLYDHQFMIHSVEQFYLGDGLYPPLQISIMPSPRNYNGSITA